MSEVRAVVVDGLGEAAFAARGLRGTPGQARHRGDWIAGLSGHRNPALAKCVQCWIFIYFKSRKRNAKN